MYKKVFYILSPDRKITVKEKSDLERIFNAFSEYLYAFQLRIKDRNILEAEILDLKDLCDDYSVPLILNDFVDLVLKFNTTGVHIGADDGELEMARKLLPRDKLIGISCYNDIQRAKNSSVADYVSFGCFFQSQTKTSPISRVDFSILDQWKNSGSQTPCVCIGGINDTNFIELLKRGADMVAFSAYLWGSNSPYERFATLIQIAKYHNRLPLD